MRLVESFLSKDASKNTRSIMLIAEAAVFDESFEHLPGFSEASSMRSTQSAVSMEKRCTLYCFCG